MPTIDKSLKLRDIQTINCLLENAISKSTCLKHRVAAVIETKDKRYVLGWNGPPKFIKHKKCLRDCYSSGKGMELCLGNHAERRAISYAAKNGVYLDEGVIYLSSWFPCVWCANSIIDAGIKRLVTPDEICGDVKKKILVKDLRNQTYNFEMAEELLMEAKIEIIVNQSIMYVDRLEEILQKSWIKETSSDSERWKKDNPSWGQCAVTALIVNDYFGGKLVWAPVNVNGKKISHYFNKIDDKKIGLTKEIDLIKNQFPEGTIIPEGIDKTKGFPSTKDYVLSYPKTVKRYELLKEKIDKQLMEK